MCIYKNVHKYKYVIRKKRIYCVSNNKLTNLLLLTQYILKATSREDVSTIKKIALE